MEEKISRVYEEMEKLRTENSALNDEINELHLLLLELGDPDEKPHPKLILRGDTWIVEGHESTENELVVNCSKEENVEIVKCDGGEEYFCIRIQPIAGKVLVENCKKLKVVTECVLYEIVLFNCEDIVLVVGGESPFIELNNCKGVGLLLSHESMDGPIELVRSGGVVLTSPLISREKVTHKMVCTSEELEAGDRLWFCEMPSYVQMSFWNGKWYARPTSNADNQSLSFES
ncbi:hypothetical protein GUITHDRAFT_161733 [Guillardia theta CCMP2712]|uniref:Adenylate cyclase-associated CAP C-terminal domain-containing protein n=2 Tax=Guillardia theta TaxID=55529 RepID=L1JQM3_GUITC|nr:hypothetical protein GUITHDRAFT_161733 [Guillardia theta CCMP2712]EKX50856.1 hypothetical protein GUITHDRAFT_161733 [Guillardia theta CCMP2712]|eukprot:XP_005837836.1 hypothetical protein GUITHDRAFT_161733 [Guillardia theta CCMP2712]